MGDAELVQQSLGLEIGDPDGCGLAFLDAPVLGDLDYGVAAGEAEIHQRHHALVFSNENVVAEPPEVEDARQTGQHLIAEEGCSRMHAAPYVLHVGLPTNFKAASFADEKHNLLLRELETDVDAVKLDGQDVPVKLKVFDLMFVPLAKWSMLLTGNYRCITPQEPRSIRDAVHGDINLSQAIYHHVDAIAQRLGADPADQVPFEKYAKAAESLLKPSSAARAVAGGSPSIERVDLLVKLISHQLGAPNAEIDRTVQIVNQKLNGASGPMRPARREALRSR